MLTYDLRRLTATDKDHHARRADPGGHDQENEGNE